MHDREIDDLLIPILDHLRLHKPGSIAGVYLYGSTVESGLRPDSDVDLLMLTRRSLTDAERDALTTTLLDTSGWKGHAARFPDVANRRPLDVTSLVVSELHPLTTRPRRDFQFGEWLREQILAGSQLRPTHDPDVVVLVAAALHAHRVLQGPELTTLVDPVPTALLRHAQLALIPELTDNLIGDERNTLLTLARILVTTETGKTVPKDLAATLVAPQLAQEQRWLLERARQEHLGNCRVDWAGESERAMQLAKTMVSLLEATGRPQT